MRKIQCKNILKRPVKVEMVINIGFKGGVPGVILYRFLYQHNFMRGERMCYITFYVRHSLVLAIFCIHSSCGMSSTRA